MLNFDRITINTEDPTLKSEETRAANKTNTS